jgi:voltage-gated potassium channel
VINEDQVKRTLVVIAKILFLPTRVIAELVKARQSDGGTRFIKNWHWTFFFAAPLSCVVIYVLSISGVSHLPPLWFVVVYGWAVPFSRCNEIFYAFLADALDQMERVEPRTALTPVERVKFAVRSYVEVVCDFGIIYFLFPAYYFSQPFRSIVHAVYFSGVTLSTVGYGDVTPSRPLTQFLVLYEVAIGLVLVVITLATYVSLVGQRDK